VEEFGGGLTFDQVDTNRKEIHAMADEVAVV
jgi:hypothetical protein